MSYGQYNQNPYHQGPAQEAGGYDGQQQEIPYGQGQYEMQNYSAAPTTGPLSQSDFLNTVTQLQTEIQKLESDMGHIHQLQGASLSRTDDSAQRQLDTQMAATQANNIRIKDGIKDLERDLARTTDSSGKMKATRINTLKADFRAKLEAYNQMENDYQKRYRQQIERQYRIVNPDASDSQIQDALSSDEGVFQQALMSSRTGQASSALGNVRARHNELKRIEQTMAEISVLFEELATVVEQQEPTIQRAEDNAIDTTVHMGKGIEETDKAKKSAARARKLKWWCALVVVLIILAIALGVGLGVGLVQSANK